MHFEPLFRDLVELLVERARQTPDRLAVDFDNGRGQRVASFTYAQLDDAARAIAAALAKRLIPGDRVMLVYPPSAEFVAGFFGCLYAGAVAVPVALPRGGRTAEGERILNIAIDCDPEVVLGPQLTVDKLAADATLARLFDTALKLDHETAAAVDPAAWVAPSVDRDGLALLMYTSGSTGLPKGVMVSHANLVHNLDRIMRRCVLDANSRALMWLPHFHDMGLIGGILDPIYAGFPTTLLAPESFVKRPMAWLRLISDIGATISGGPNFCYALCAQRFELERLEGVDLSRWTCAFNGAEPLLASVVARFAELYAPYGFRREAMYPCYGMAESTLSIASNAGARRPLIRNLDSLALRTESIARPALPGGPVQRFVSCGRASPDQIIAIVDPRTGAALPENRVGEIWTSDASVARGYWNKPYDSQQTFQARLVAHGDRPFLRTGDLGFLSNDELFIVGRVKELIIINGRNHYPTDIEATADEALGAKASRGIVAFARCCGKY